MVPAPACHTVSQCVQKQLGAQSCCAAHSQAQEITEATLTVVYIVRTHSWNMRSIKWIAQHVGQLLQLYGYMAWQEKNKQH